MLFKKKFVQALLTCHAVFHLQRNEKFTVNITVGEDTEELRTGEVKYIKMSNCAAEEFLNFGV